MLGAAAALYAGDTAGRKALELVVEDAYNGAKDIARKQLAKWRNARTLDTLYTKIADVRNVKTIWQIDKPVDLMNFYWPSSLLVGDQRKQIDKIADFEYAGNIVIEGLVGHGKSILLRFLCAQEMITGQRIPLFYQLRRFADEPNLRHALLERMRVLGFEVSEQTFEYLARKGTLVLLLDAFDEVPEKQHGSLVQQLEDLSNEFPKLQVVITTRPESSIEYSPSFQIFRMSDVNKSDVHSVIAKLTGSIQIASDVCKALDENAGDVYGLLKTPLMITLLLITYQAHASIPSTLSEFYSQLFSVVLSRHDETKPGLGKRTTCGMPDSDIRRAFDALCFGGRLSRQVEFSYTELEITAKKGLAAAGLQTSVDDFINDIIRITNLVLKEGNRYCFIHKSVEEFHAASYVRSLADPSVAHDFYTMLSQDWHYWLPEVRFLSEIDAYRCAKHFLIPSLTAALDATGLSEVHPLKAIASSDQLPFLDDVSLRLHRDGPGSVVGFGFSPSDQVALIANLCCNDRPGFFDQLFACLNIRSLQHAQPIASGSSVQLISLRYALEIGGADARRLTAWARSVAKSVKATIELAQQTVQKEESLPKSIFGF